LGKGENFLRGLGLGLRLYSLDNGNGGFPVPFTPPGGPWCEHPLAWEYLLPERPMTRRVDILEVHSQRWGLKKMELDVGFPASYLKAGHPSAENSRCLVPVAYIPKRPVASDLEVRNGNGALVSFPTRKECMGLTELAISQIRFNAPRLLDHPATDYALTSKLTTRIGEVISREPLRARISRLDIEENHLDPAAVLPQEWLLPLLRRLEDHYMLWAPIEGRPKGDHRLTIQRSDRSDLDPILTELRQRRVQKFIVKSDAGDLEAEWNPPREWLRGFDLPALVGRVLVSFGLMPVKFEQEPLEANRFSSYHLRMVPPANLMVREVKVGGIDEAQWGTPNPLIKPLKSGVSRTVHGEGTRTGHVHLEMDPNPSWLYSRITIGLRPGTTTLWGVVVVLTCALLWAMHREVNRLLGLDPGGEAQEVQIQIAAAVLLVGPTFAAAWTLRLRDPALIRNMLAGTQALLMGAAIVSVATALVLAEIIPLDWEPATAIEWYASFSYAIAVLIVIGWLQARSSVWLIYRRLLNRTWKNLVAVIGLSLLSCFAVRRLGDSPAISTLALFFTGFSLTAVAGNRTSVRLGEVSRLPAAVAGVGAILTLALASRELGFFNRLADRGFAHHYGGNLELVLAGAAFLLLLDRGRRFYKAGKPSKGAKTKAISAKTPVPVPKEKAKSS
jgi:hypothetical protein